ncbi:MAG: (2Fe-2S)-binding protein [Spirochaetae bacterium HGW-Spirochaetae-7]|jgi:adenylate cyclase|nr:MAG: (2Fe-2S)-binding protein [Spirochaetae bacterium HGW-Spirochaetae-7]
MARAKLAWADRPAAEFETSPAMSILVSVQRAGLPLRHDCGGKAQCGTCRVRLVSGRLSPMGERERLRLAAVSAGDGVRLACQARPGSDVELEAVMPLVRDSDAAQLKG